MVFRYYVFCIGYYSTIYKFVIINISLYQMKRV